MMKKIYLLFVLTIASVYAVNGQQQFKIGYTSVEAIIQSHPKTIEIDKQLQVYQKELQDQINVKREKLYTLTQDYQRKEHIMTDLVKEDKQREIVSMQENLEKFARDSEAAFQKEQQIKMQPLLEEIQTAIDAVAKENGYNYILNYDVGMGMMPILLYGPEEDNVTDLILKKLGIAIPKPTGNN